MDKGLTLQFSSAKLTQLLNYFPEQGGGKPLTVCVAAVFLHTALPPPFLLSLD